MATGVLSQQQQRRLQQLYEQTNPLQLRQAIYVGLTRLWEQTVDHEASAA